MTSPYRNDEDALREQETKLRAALAESQERSTELRSQLEAVGRQIATRRRLVVLEHIRIASPCDARFVITVGDARAVEVVGLGQTPR